MRWLVVAALIVLSTALLRAWLSRGLVGAQLRSRLTVSPTRIGLLQLLSVYASLLSRSLGPLSSVPPLKASGDGFELPAIEVEAPVVLDASDLRRYRTAVGGDDDEAAPWLAAGPVSLMLPLLLSHPRCPIAPLGSVNTSVVYESLRPDLLSLKHLLGAPDLRIVASLHPRAERKKRGVEFAVHADFFVGDAKAFSVVFKVRRRPLISLIPQALKFLPSSHPPRFNAGAQSAEPSEPKLEPVGVSVPIDHGDVMAWVRPSGSSALTLQAHYAADYQPIHVGGPMAKLFGLPGPIAHGQLVGIKLAHELHQATTKSSAAAAADELWFGDKPWRSTLVFKRPMPYPIELEGSMGRVGGDAIAFSLARGDKVHITGEVAAL